MTEREEVLERAQWHLDHCPPPGLCEFCSHCVVCKGTLALSADLTAAQERIRLLEGAIEGACRGGHDEDCAFTVWDRLRVNRRTTAPKPKCTCFKAVLALKEPTK